MASTPLPNSVSSFRQAIGLALLLGESQTDSSIAICLSKAFAVQTVRSTTGATIELVAQLISERPAKAGDHLLVLTHSPIPLGGVSDSDLFTYSLLRHTGELVGRRLLDWVATDGDDIRSFAYLTHPVSAWRGDPALSRRADFRASTASDATRK